MVPYINSALVFILIPTQVLTIVCSRYPANTFTPKSPVDENFVVAINGNPQTYILGQEYNISLHAYNGLRFISFSLVLENDEGDTTYHEDLGHFEIIDTVETRYSPNCINMVDSTNTNPKTRIDVTWIAPSQPGNGCILIRATVLQHRDVWHMDDGGLTKRICEEVVDDVESKNVQQSEQTCCACDEARYELTFEGMWSRNLHPKDFPAKGWTTRFSDIVGAAHTTDYRFWEYGALATTAMQEFAEYGSSRLLEKEFNMHFRNGKIRTIIKARGPAFPNLNGQSLASVRVDPQHHLVSLATKIEPSPDWIVGISGLELCHANCTWLEQKIINLYPWDIGTDAGPSYTSPNQPQVPPDVIRRMRSDFPNDPRSPFFDETGAPMKPLATLTIKRQRLYERACEDPESNNVNIPHECYTHPWSAWTQCTTKCGEGKQYRSRVYKQPEVARIYNCDVMTVKRQDRPCTGTICGGDTESMFRAQQSGFLNPQLEFMDGGNYAVGSRAECQLSPWSDWSPCNVTCGEGKMMRKRQYTNSYAEQSCQSVRFLPLVEFKNCMGRNCLGEIGNRPQYNENFGANEEQYDRPTNDYYPYGGDKRPAMPNEFDDQSYQYNGNYKSTGGEAAYDGGIYNKNAESINEPYDVPAFGYNSDLQVENLNQGNQAGNRYAQQKIQSEQYRQPYEQTKTRQRQTFAQSRQPVDEYQQTRQQYGQSNDPYSARDIMSENTPSNDQQRTSASDLNIVSYCFEPLQLFNCLDSTVVGNYWFYNYCEDTCMLYAADACDRNQNKFNSLEMCELRCKQPMHTAYLRKKQQMECPKQVVRPEQKLHDYGGRSSWRV